MFLVVRRVALAACRCVLGAVCPPSVIVRRLFVCWMFVVCWCLLFGYCMLRVGCYVRFADCWLVFAGRRLLLSVDIRCFILVGVRCLV